MYNTKLSEISQFLRFIYHDLQLETNSLNYYLLKTS